LKRRAVVLCVVPARVVPATIALCIALTMVAPAQARTPTRRSPSGPPLVRAAASTATAPAGEGDPAPAGEEDSAAAGEEDLQGVDASSSAPSSGGDPLEENGLGSPLCAAAGELSASSRRNCATSGFEAAGAPTGNYGLDVHINTGALGFTAATLEQDYLIGPVWMSLVWVVHTLVVALEWCFTLDLLDGSTMGGVERSLRDTQAAFTRPWLVLALALASLAAAYNGLVRRRVAETLGQAALMLAMMAGGLWVIADPTGTIGALGRWVDEASAGTVGAVVEGTPAHASRTLADSMGGLFAGVIGAPWCYLEFGDVRWCVEPSLLDRRLHEAGLRIAAGAQAGGACSGASGGAGPWESETLCQVLAGEQPPQRAQSATLLREARTNGELFLALPADEAARNSITERASLLSVLCGGSEEATDCRGPTAGEAEFRTQGGTAARVGGLLLIAIGALGMILLLGFIALHLLGSELIGLLYLLLAPAAVVAPALGDGGRAAFHAWATRLIGAVTSKLLFSFLLGVVLLLTRTLLELYAFGWWTRWLLVSALWWGSYFQRRRVLGFVQGELHVAGRAARSAGGQGPGASGRGPGGGGHGPGGGGQPGHRHSLARRQFESPLAALRAAQWVRGKLAKPAPSVEPRKARERIDRERTQTKAREQVTGMLKREHRQAIEEVADAPRTQAELGEKRAQLQRVQRAHTQALVGGDARRAAALALRAQRIESEVADGQTRLTAAHRIAARGERTRRASGRRYTRTEAEARGRFLDAQAALPANARAGGVAGAPRRAPGGAPNDTPRRDYAALAGLAGYGRAQYERLDPRHRREARLRIDRELALRRQLRPAVSDLGAASGSRAQTGSGAQAGSRAQTGAAVPRQNGVAGPRSHRESTVMRDAREVALRRKRQLGG
jgi:hypothetical protein